MTDHISHTKINEEGDSETDSEGGDLTPPMEVSLLLDPSK